MTLGGEMTWKCNDLAVKWQTVKKEGSKMVGGEIPPNRPMSFKKKKNEK
jgi:hypothetical protein